jgi:aspartyl-tRNA(Asn)/glutamyl-tRNA(Gln) amidotransferase subunit B
LIQNGSYYVARIAKDVIEWKFEKSDARDPSEIVKQNDWYQMEVTSELEALCRKILEQYPEEVKEFKAGRDRRMKHFVGMVMKETKGKAPGPVVTEMFQRLIKDM